MPPATTRAAGGGVTKLPRPEELWSPQAPAAVPEGLPEVVGLPVPEADMLKPDAMALEEVDPILDDAAMMLLPLPLALLAALLLLLLPPDPLTTPP
jgi:hypothetical protein